MSGLFTVKRAINGISINGTEYLLNDKGTEPLTFETQASAIEFLKLNMPSLEGATDEEMLDIFIIEQE